MTVGRALQDWEKGWFKLKNLVGFHFIKTGRFVWLPEKKGSYLRDISRGRFKVHESIADLDDCPACLYATSKAFPEKSHLDPFLFFIGWVIFQTRGDLDSANKILTRLYQIDKEFQDIDISISSGMCRWYLEKVIEAAIAVFQWKLTMLSEGFKTKIRQKAADMGYHSAIKNEENKLKRFQRSVDKKKGPDGTVPLRLIQRYLNLKIPPAIKKSGREEIRLLNKYRLARFLEGMAERGFLDIETGICRGIRKDQLHFRFSSPKKTRIK
jgi:hypothetical protein